MIRIFALLAVFGLSACVVATTPSTPVVIATNGANAAVDTDIAFSSQNGDFGALLNAQRAANGLPALRANSRLTAAASAHAGDMVAGNFFSHTGSNGSSVGDRARIAGYCWMTVAENLAFGSFSTAAVVEGWMNSPAHRRNMLKSNVSEFGYAKVGDKYVLVLARPC